MLELVIKNNCVIIIAQTMRKEIDLSDILTEQKPPCRSAYSEPIFQNGPYPQEPTNQDRRDGMRRLELEYREVLGQMTLDRLI